MKRRILAVLAAIAALAALAAPPYALMRTALDPTLMREISRDPGDSIVTLTAFMPEPSAEWTVLVWQRATATATGLARIAANDTSAVSAAWNMAFLLSTEPARSTREGGAELADEQPWIYDTPLALDANGQFALADALPATIVNNTHTNTVICVNVETDAALTLTFGAEERQISAKSGKQIFNVQLSTASRAVSVAAASPEATVKLGWGQQPFVKFYDAEHIMCMDTNGIFQGTTGGDEPYIMAVCRAAISNGTLRVQTGYLTATNDNWLAVREQPTDAVRFAKDARMQFQTYVGAGMTNGCFSAFKTYGAKSAPQWLSDVQLRRIADLDTKTLHRRGETFPNTDQAYWDSIQ